MPTIVEHRKFSLTDLSNNNNKYWNITLFDNDDVMSEWGRQGKTSQSKTWSGVGSSFMDKKIAAKDKKGYRENKVLEGVGEIKTSGTSVANIALKDIASKQIKSKNPLVAKLVDFLIKVNAHAIGKATGGKITYDTSTATFRTTQGVVIPEQVDRARFLLSDMSDYVKSQDWSGLEEDLNEYLSIIPRDFGMKRMSPADILGDMSDVQKELDILDGLASSFAGLQTATPKKTTKKKKAAPKIFDVTMEIVDNTKIISDIRHLYQSTRKSMHQSNNLSVETVYKIEIKNMKASYDKHGAAMSNVKRLWHGTKASNLLSIMKQGLIIPPSSSNHCTGRMYGNGVYFSSISTKALNYATNYWGNSGSSDRTFMFLADVAMGKYHLAKTAWADYPKRGFDSTWAKGGVAGVINDEMIVYKLSQCNLVYLVEFVNRKGYRG